MTKLSHRHANQAVIFILISYACYSVADTLAKYMSGFHTLGLLLVMNGGFALTINILWIWRHYDLSIFKTPRLPLHLTRSVAIGIMSFCAVSALSRIPLPDFYGIIFLSPFFVLLVARIFLGEVIGWHRLTAITLGFVGVLILAGPTFTTPNIGYLFVFCQVIMISANVLLVRRMGTQEPLPFYTFFPGLGVFIAGIVMSIPALEIPALADLPLLLFYALVIFCGQLTFTFAYMRTPLTSIIAPYVYTQMLWGSLASIFVFNHTPTPTTLMGAAVIISSGLGLIAYEYRLRRREALGAQPIPID